MQRILKDYVLCWIDPDISGNDASTQHLLQQLRALVHQLCLFTTIDEGLGFLTEVKNEQVLITMTDCCEERYEQMPWFLNVSSNMHSQSHALLFHFAGELCKDINIGFALSNRCMTRLAGCWVWSKTLKDSILLARRVPRVIYRDDSRKIEILRPDLVSPGNRELFAIECANPRYSTDLIS